jgi:hypothetical protein
MQRRLAFFAPFTGLLFAFGCTTSVKVGTDGSGAGTTTGSGTTTSGPTTSGATSSTTTSSTTSSSTTSSSTTSSSGTGTGGACGWDGSPVSNAGGPCGGNIWANPPTCATGLTCVAPLPDVVGTCARPGTPVSGLGGTCGGLAALPCTWNLFCELPNGIPDALGTCVHPTCAAVDAGAGGSGTGGGPVVDAGTGGGCTDPLVTVEGDGATKQFSNRCDSVHVGQNPMAASGYISHLVPPCNRCGDTLTIDGCLKPDDYTGESIDLQADLGTVGTSAVAVKYFDGMETNVTSGTGYITVTELGPDTISGFYTATVTPTSNGATLISGTFRVCRSPDVTE